jgi:ADP-heptose:LPS heptosyltransferase
LVLDHDQIYWFYYEHDQSLHILDGYELSTGLHLKDRTLSWTVSEEERAHAESVLDGMKRPIVGFSPTCGHALRNLPLWKIQQVIDLVREAMDATVVVTADQCLDLKGCANLASQTSSMRELAAIMAQSDVWIMIDSGPLHLAQALAVPAVGIFGCTLPELRATRPSHLRIVRNETLSCLGCYHTIKRGAEGLSVCSRGDIACMATINEFEVLFALGEVLQKRADPSLATRLAAYETHRQQRMKAASKDSQQQIAREYQAHIEAFYKRGNPLKQLERAFRRWRKQHL